MDFQFNRIFVLDRTAERPGEVAVLLRRHRRARNYIIRVVDSACVRVTIPRGGSRSAALEFFEQQRDWVQRELEKLDSEQYRKFKTWREGTRVWYRGEKLPLQFVAGEDVSFIQLGEVSFPFRGPEADIQTIVESGLRSIAAKELPADVALLAERTGLHPSAVTIRAQRTRWGSCSARGRLSLNWRLIQVPLAVKEYVVIHELCHLRHLNHSRQFWQLVQRYCPSFRRHETWLRQQGDSVFAGCNR